MCVSVSAGEGALIIEVFPHYTIILKDFLKDYTLTVDHKLYVFDDRQALPKPLWIDTLPIRRD